MTKQEWCELQPQRFPRRGPAGEPRMAKMVVEFWSISGFWNFLLTEKTTGQPDNFGKPNIVKQLSGDSFA